MAYQVKTLNFEGPLDLLLTLIEDRKLSINTVSLAVVTEGYFTYLKTLETHALEFKEAFGELADFLRVAAALILIKSRSLLPEFALSPEEEEDVSNLTERLEEYQRLKHAAEALSTLALHVPKLHYRTPFVMSAPSFLPAKNIVLEEMPDIMRRLLGALPEKKVLPEKHVAEVISIEEKISDLEQRIEKGLVGSFKEFIGEKKDQTNVIVCFLALLELVKIGVIAAHQNDRFGDIAFKRLSERHE